MNILFLMIAYPDANKNSSMYTDLTMEFAKNNYNVYVAVANGNGKTCLKLEGGINVLRVKTMELFKTSFIRKGLANILLPYQVNKAIKEHWNGIRFDIIVVSTPPITFVNTIKKLRKKFKSTVYLILRDIFPQNARDLGILKNPILISIFRKQEKKLYSICDYIGCMSAGNIDYIIKYNPELNKGKLHILPNWKKVLDFSPPDQSLKRQFGLADKFIVLYGGNIGKPQQVEFILDLAQEMSVHDDVVFIFIGDGSEKKRIVDLSVRKGLRNVLFKDPLPRHQYQEVVKLCDIGLVNISNKFTIPNIPSRTLSYWEAKIPILAAIDANTDYREILNQSGSGLWSITGDLDSYIKNFERLYSDKELRNTMGENGYNYLLENCTTSKAFSIINEMLFS